MVIFIFAWGCRPPERPKYGGLQPLLEAIAEAGVDVKQLGPLMVDGMVENLSLEDAAVEFSKRPDDLANSVIAVRVDMNSNESLKKLADSIQNHGGLPPTCWIYTSRAGFRWASLNANFSHLGRRSDGDHYIVLMRWFLDGDYSAFVDDEVGYVEADRIEYVDDNVKHLIGESFGAYWIGRDVVFIHRVDHRRRQ